MMVILCVLFVASGFAQSGGVGRPRDVADAALVELKVPSDLDYFFYVVAINFKAPAPCQEIDPLADGGGDGFSQRGYQIQTLRSECYDELARILHDAKLCEQVRPVRTNALDGSRMDKAYCLTHLHGPTTVAVPDVHNMGPFVGLMRKLGYDDRHIAEFRLTEGPYDGGTYGDWQKLRADPMLLDRVRAASSYAEKPLRARLRPANAAEFLYQMAAIDTPEASLCGKISPNATFIDMGGKTALLRSRCYVTIAYNKRNAALCEQLPRAGEFPYVNPIYDSRESCHETVAIYSRPGFDDGGLHYGPSRFPNPSYFEDALLEIGYAKSDVDNLISKPTSDDYWDFLSHLSLRGSSQDRAEFLRRVMSLK
jgi:hypothetical protein